MTYDFLIVGAGISGASAGYELAASGSVILVEAESIPGFHSTGRSAALYTPNYGPALVRSISKRSYDLFSSPPEGFTEHSLLSPRGLMLVALQHQRAEFQARGYTPGLAELNAQEVLAKVPFLQGDQVVGGFYEEGVFDMDVNALHQGYLKGLTRRGGEVLTDSPITSMKRSQTSWLLTAGDQELKARVVVNAAGAWADQIGQLAGAKSIGLVPKARTAALIDAPVGLNLDTVPAVDFMGCENYIKPEKHQLMLSPGDEKPVPAHDVQADDYDIAVLVDWLESTTEINVTKVNHSWAGLRSFVSDGKPAVGFDGEVDDFFWLAGQGGYGIMMAPALAIATAELITQRCLPADFIDAGITTEALSPGRFS